MGTLGIAVLLVAGALCELYGLSTIARDVSAASTTAEEIAAESKTVMAANKHVVRDWLSRATVGTSDDVSRRKHGLIAFGIGLALQTAANLIALG